MAEQPFPLPLTDGDRIGSLSLFLENWCDGNDNLQTKLQVSPPVYVSSPMRQISPEGRSWSSPRHPHAGALLRPSFRSPYYLAHFPHWSSHSFMASYPSNSPGQCIFLGKFIPANIHPSNVNSYPMWRDVRKPWKQRPEKEGHIQGKVTSSFSISIKVRVTVYGNRRHFRQKWFLFKFTNISMCLFIPTNSSSSLQPYYTLEVCCICRQFFTGWAKHICWLWIYKFFVFQIFSHILIQSEQKLVYLYIHGVIPGGVLCRARSGTLMVLVGLFQISIFHDYYFVYVYYLWFKT